MRYDYTGDAQDLLEAIREMGQVMTLYRGTTPYACYGLQRSYRQREIDGTVVKVGDIEATIAASGLAIIPTTTDKLKLEGSTLQRTIVLVDTIKPGPLALAYKLQVR
ncbi:MAG: hypothetical protein LDL11_06640 [Desulfarculus sp.]|nr:hypothetical protein [Desulfarculus sp.]